MLANFNWPISVDQLLINRLAVCNMAENLYFIFHIIKIKLVTVLQDFTAKQTTRDNSDYERFYNNCLVTDN